MTLDSLLLRRFSFALVIAFGAVAAVVYAQGVKEDETLAGTPVVVEEDFGCPDAYPLPVTVDSSNSTVDRNRDGIVCLNGNSKEFVDNTGADQDYGSGSVSGHGNFFDRGAMMMQMKMQDISFSFHAIGTGRGNDARGEFEYHDQTADGPDLTVHGDVLCVFVDRQAATLVGVVTRSNDEILAEGALVVWRAEDNGEGANDRADQVSRLSPFPSQMMPKDVCRIRFAAPIPSFIENGNIQIH